MCCISFSIYFKFISDTPEQGLYPDWTEDQIDSRETKMNCSDFWV